jgi:hypothetical protein
MARTGRPQPRPREPLPPPLPPETRTVGQLVAETVRFYGRHFWRSLALGLGPAGLAVGETFLGRWGQFVLVAAGGGLLLSVAYTAGCAIVAGGRVPLRTLATALAAALVIWIPVPFLALGIFLPALAWMAFAGLAVPAAIFERIPLRRALGRGMQLGRADYVHSLGSLAALAIVVGATGSLLSLLIHTGSNQAARIALFLASLVVSPLAFLGSALLYHDQAARAKARQ